MAKLFESIKFRDITLRNRIGVSPMCMYSAVDGLPQPWHAVHLGSRAVGGAGVVIAEATGVAPEGRITPYCTGIWNEKQVEAWAPIAAFMKSQGAVPGIQIAHAGRKAEGDWENVGASAVAFGGGLIKPPKPLDREGLARIRRAFQDAARRCLTAGFEWLEIHSAHGYLLHSFLSPISNKREDDYGGSYDNRIRLLLEVTSDVRSVWPSRLPLTVRLSCTDWEEGGWDLPQSVELAGRLKRLGVDLVDCSSGGMTPTAKIPAAPGYQVPFAEAIRKEAGIPTAAVGMISEAAQAEQILKEGKADMIYLARAFLSDPYWPAHAAKALGVPDACRLPKQYGRA